jgi:hypothetical protein
MTKLVITFCVNEDLLLLPAWRRSNFIGKGDLTSFAPPEAPSTVDGYQWNERVSWFTICYWYCRRPEGGFGPALIAASQFVYLGSWSPLSPEHRAELISKIAECIE